MTKPQLIAAWCVMLAAAAITVMVLGMALMSMLTHGQIDWWAEFRKLWQ